MNKQRGLLGCMLLGILVWASILAFGYLKLRSLIYGPSLGDQPPLPLHQVWSQELDQKVQGLVADNTGAVILARTDGALWGLEPQAGKVLWHSALRRQLTGFSPVFAAGRAFVTDEDSIWAFDIRSGAISWRQKLADSNTWVTDASERLVLVNTVSQSITAYDAATGVQLWSAPVGRGYVRAYAGDRVVYFIDDAIQERDARTGNQIWRRNYRNTGDSLFLPGILYLVTGQTDDEFQVVALDLDRRIELWKSDFARHGGDEYLGQHDDFLFVATARSFFTVAAGTGRVLWQQPLGNVEHSAVLGDKVYVMQNFSGVLQSLDLGTGHLSGALRVDAPQLVHVYHDDLAVMDTLLIEADGNSIQAYSK